MAGLLSTFISVEMVQRLVKLLTRVRGERAAELAAIGDVFGDPGLLGVGAPTGRDSEAGRRRRAALASIVGAGPDLLGACEPGRMGGAYSRNPSLRYRMMG